MKPIVQRIGATGMIFFILAHLLGMKSYCQEPAPLPIPTIQSDANDKNPKTNWAREYLAEDPVAGQEHVSLNDIRSGIESPRRRGTVITLHFGKVTDATNDQKRDFLVQMLKSEFSEVQRQASRELAKLGWLEDVLKKMLLEYLESEDPDLRRAAVIGLEAIAVAPQELSDAYRKSLVEALGDSEELVARSASDRLIAMGTDSVPYLIEALRSKDISLQREAAHTLSRIVGSKKAPVPPKLPEATSRSKPMMARPPRPAPEPTIAKAEPLHEPKHSARELDESKPKPVRVYFGTNRELLEETHPSWVAITSYPVLGALLILAIISNLRMPSTDRKRGCTSYVLPLLMLAGALWAAYSFRGEIQQRWKLATGPSFGLRRDPSEKVHYGMCDVSIPPTHKIGEVESPVFGPENEERHVVLQRTQELEERAFFDLLKKRVSELSTTDRSCFVFIHGFNVDFPQAAKRTAQIHHDLRFPGIPIFFSWPSRASVRHYFSDRNEIEFSRYVIKQFLLDIVEKVKADRIHVIAHSMGADATSRAIADLGDKGKIFDQIILAAPDIDREVFRLQIVPRMTGTANRTTLYCSKSDWALIASRTFNDAARAGDSSHGVLVTKEVDTIDASNIDTDLLGHSYYGDCLPILRDVQQMIGLDLTPVQRKLKPWPVDDELLYWTLPSSESKESVPPSQEEVGR